MTGSQTAIEFAAGRGHPDHPLLDVNHSSRSAMPCTDFRVWIIGRLRDGDLETVVEVVYEVCSADAGVPVRSSDRDGIGSTIAQADTSWAEFLAESSRARTRSLLRLPLESLQGDGSHSTLVSGNLDTLLSPTTTAEQLATLTTLLDERKPALRAADTTPSGPIDDCHQAHRPLSRAGTAHMATIDGGINPSWTGFMCLLAAANAGWTLRDLEHAAKTAPGMEHYRTKNTGRGGRRPRSASESRARLEQQWDKAQQYAALQRPLPADREPRDLTELGAIVHDVDTLLGRLRASPGRWGRTEKALSQRTILTAVAYLTLQTGKRTVAASIRDLALIAA